MQKKPTSPAELLGQITGYVLGYLLFSTVLFTVLHFSHKIPSDWSYAHILGAVAILVFVGTGLERILR